jgi:hypothetical protein
VCSRPLLLLLLPDALLRQTSLWWREQERLPDLL